MVRIVTRDGSLHKKGEGDMDLLEPVLKELDKIRQKGKNKKGCDRYLEVVEQVIFLFKNKRLSSNEAWRIGIFFVDWKMTKEGIEVFIGCGLTDSALLFIPRLITEKKLSLAADFYLRLHQYEAAIKIYHRMGNHKKAKMIKKAIMPVVLKFQKTIR